MATLANAEDTGLLNGRRDAYDGLIIDPQTLPSSPEVFHEVLTTSLSNWREQKYRGIWLKLPIDKAHFVGYAVDSGFVFHHAEPVSESFTVFLHFFKFEKKYVPQPFDLHHPIRLFETKGLHFT